MIRIVAIPVAVLALLAALAACTTAETTEPREFLVFFQTDNAELTPEAREVVDEAAAAVRDAGPSKIVVEGEADGHAARDGALANQRADTVVQALAATARVDSGAIEKGAHTVPRPVVPVAAHKVTVLVVPKALSGSAEASLPPDSATK